MRFLRVRNDADREFMLNAFEGKEPVTNKALVVRLYRKIPEWSGVEKELKLKGDSPLANLEARRAEALKRREAEKNPVPIAVVMSNEVSRISKSAKPLMEIIRAAEAEFAKPAGKRNRAKMEKARETIRRAWLAHAFGGTRLSSVLLMSDLMLGDRRSAVSDALTVLLTDREDPSANAALGAIRQEEGKFELAERYLRKGVKGGGAFPMGKLAILLIQTDRAAEAVEWARKAVKVSPNDPSLREPLVAALIETGKLNEAEAELKELEKIARQGGGDQKKELKFAAEARKRIGGKRPGK